jgi:DNA polymerase I-like protein with 3'-5' exonuclease and polymerase domains
VRLLVNYHPDEKGFLSLLSYHLKKHGLTAMSTSKTLTIGELLDLAKKSSADAILLCNEQTLKHCVPGDKPTLDKWRGSFLKFSVPTIVCNKLEHIHTVDHGGWLLDKDLEKFKYVHIPSPVFQMTVLDSIDKFEECLDVMEKCLFTSYDIETKTPDEPEDSLEVEPTIITCAGWTAALPDGTFKTYVLPFVNFGVDHWRSDSEYALAIQLMQEINHMKMAKCMHNGMYDATHSIVYHAEPYNYVLDTMAFAHAEFAELPKTLDFVASYQLHDYVYWKDEAEKAAKNKDINAYWMYNGKDTWYTARILVKQLRTLPVYAKKNYANKFKLVYPSLYCNFEGFAILQEKREELRAISVKELERAQTTLRVMFADPNFNPGSWQQVEKYIYHVVGAKRPRIGKSKSCTDEKNLLAVAEQHPLLYRMCMDIIEYRGAQKAIGTYYDFLQYKGRLLWAMNPFGTETERMACNASSFWCGTQVQNIPSYAKAMLVADEGHELIEIDNSQSEGRCTAYCSQEVALIQAIESKTHDFYRTLGTLFFRMKYEDVTDFFRNKVLKKIVHGTNYMMGGKTFTENIGLKILMETAKLLGIKLVPVPRANAKDQMTVLQFAKSLLEAYHVPFPRVREWYKEIYNEVKTTGRLTSPLGHVRIFFGDIGKKHSLLTGAVAHQPQNLSVEILNRGFWNVYKYLVLPSNGEFRLKAQIHDSILAQYPTYRRGYYAPRMKALMYNPVVVHGRTLIIPTDVKVGKVWKERDEDNLEGTVKYKVPEDVEKLYRISK